MLGERVALHGRENITLNPCLPERLRGSNATKGESKDRESISFAHAASGSSYETLQPHMSPWKTLTPTIAKADISGERAAIHGREKSPCEASLRARVHSCRNGHQMISALAAAHDASASCPVEERPRRISLSVAFLPFCFFMRLPWTVDRVLNFGI